MEDLKIHKYSQGLVKTSWLDEVEARKLLAGSYPHRKLTEFLLILYSPVVEDIILFTNENKVSKGLSKLPRSLYFE